MKQEITITDVARLAGVSIATVSRVMNGNKTVGTEIQERVRNAISLSGYSPNAVAQSMRRQRTSTIGLIVTNVALPGHAGYVRALQHLCHDAGYTLLLANTGGDQTVELEALTLFIQRRADGIIVLAGGDQDQNIAAAMLNSSVPIVLVSRDAPEALDRVVIDDHAGIWQATRHLLMLGHRRIALITGTRAAANGRERAEGFAQAYVDLGMALELGMVCVGGFSAEFGFEQASLLLSGEARPTAIIAGGLDMLPGVLRAVQQRRITVPQELSLVGMGGTMWAELCSPPVGVVRWDFDDLGRISAKLLFERIDQRGQDRPRRFVFPTEFLPRGSCAPPKASIES